jgi:hypothetical protein
MPFEFNPQPQSRAEFVKNEKRIKDLVAKCGGDKQKEVNKAAQMANSIDTPEKAYNRGHVARELGYEHIFEVFYQRAYELGSVTTAEHRDHQIEKILSDVEDIVPQKKEKKIRNVKKIENPEYIDNILGCIDMANTISTVFIPKETWKFHKTFENYREESLCPTDYDFNLCIDTEEKCMKVYEFVVSRLEKEYTKDMEDEGSVIGVYKNGNNSVVFATDLDYAWENSLLYNTGIIPNDEVLNYAHFSPSKFMDETPEKYEQIKGLFHTKWN